MPTAPIEPGGFKNVPVWKPGMSRATRTVPTSKPSAPWGGSQPSRIPPKVITPPRIVAGQTGGAVIPEYHQRYDLDNIRFVDRLQNDRAQSSREEHGDFESTGAPSGSGRGSGPVFRVTETVSTTKTTQQPDWIKPVLLALAAYLIFGG